MECPEGFEEPGKICKLNKSIYGLKQSPRCWNQKFDSILRNFNMKQSSIDSCFYFSGDKSIMLAVYVDDGLLATKELKRAHELLDALNNIVELKRMECSNYLGFEVEMIKNNCEARASYKLTQTRQIEKILKHFKMGTSNPLSTPEEQFDPNADFRELSEGVPFKELVGSLLYVARMTRPDIMHAVSIASKVAKPSIDSWNRLKRILRDLNSTRNMGLRYDPSEVCSLEGYTDSDYAGDVETRRSTSGCVIMLGNSPVGWRCQRQQVVSLSTTESEYIAACELVEDIIPVRRLLREIGVIDDRPTPISIDNSSAVKMAQSGNYHRTKHIDVRHKWLSGLNEKKIIEVKHVRSEEQLADALTKPLKLIQFKANIQKLMCLAVVLIISLLGVVTGARTKMGTIFRWVDPVYYVSTEIPFESGITSYDWNITVLNSCSNFFTNATPDNGINAALLDDCQKSFGDKVTKSLIYCKTTNTLMKRYQAEKTRATRGRRSGARRHASLCVGDQ